MFANGGHEFRRMQQEIVIRSEMDADFGAITEVTIAAFKTLKISHHTEHFIIAAVCAAKALTVSLVAELGGTDLDPSRCCPRTSDRGLVKP